MDPNKRANRVIGLAGTFLFLGCLVFLWREKNRLEDLRKEEETQKLREARREARRQRKRERERENQIDETGEIEG